MVQAIVKGKLVGAVRSNPAGNAVHATVEVLEGPSESMTGKKLTLVSFARYYPDAVEYLRSLAPGDEVDVAGKLETNDYGGVARLQLVVRERGNTTDDRGEWVSPEDVDVPVQRDESHADAWRRWWTARPPTCDSLCYRPHNTGEACNVMGWTVDRPCGNRSCIAGHDPDAPCIDSFPTSPYPYVSEF